MNTLKGLKGSLALAAETCNPRYLGVRDQEDHSSRLAGANSSGDAILKISNAKQGWQSDSSSRVPA
jgi:hypothetical protein